MARLLRDLDYLRVIQSDNLDQIIESNPQTLLDVEQSAQAEMTSYLVQRYKTNEVFTNTSVFDDTLVYYAKNLVEYTAPTFSAATVYSTDDRVVYLGYIYNSIAGSVAHAFDPSEWTLICADKSLFYVSLPESEYDAETTYAIGDNVWYADKVYTNVISCVNILPTVSEYWGTGDEYSITGNLPDDTSVWSAGDNRNQQIVLFLIDVVLYHLHSRINPRNIPDLRKERYNGNDPMDRGGAIGWLKSVAHGKVSADLPVYSPEQGLSMRYGNAGTTSEPSDNMLW